MNKTVCLFLALFLIVLLPACFGSTAEKPPDLIPESDNPLLCSEFFTDAISSGTGEKYWYIRIYDNQKNDLPGIDSEKFAAYLTEFASEKVKDSGYSWVSVIFDDGTGICFTGSNTIVANYGNVDDEGCITGRLGTYVKGSGGFEYEESSICSIPNPSLKQETLVPDNSFSPAPVEIFTMTAVENGLGDTTFYADGEIVSRISVSDYDTIRVAMEKGDLYISAVLIDLPEISEGDAVTVYFFIPGGRTNSAAHAAFIFTV